MHVSSFNKQNPQLWFAQLERAFRLSDITSDIDKFDWVTIHLEHDILLTVEDLITQPPADNRYNILKGRLLAKYSESAESKLRRLLQGGDTAGMKPSEILSHMKRLAPDPGSAAVIRTLFLGQMPSSVRPLLTVWKEDNLEQLAQIADKMLEAVNSNSINMIATHGAESYAQAPTVNAIANENTPLTEIASTLKSLAVAVKQLQSDVKILKRNPSQRSSSKGRSPSRNTPSTSDQAEAAHV
ncbi:uncharacterized protein LOC118757383 [Rhagoletis pomonella]|uniref:uncharacterized protein LOC118757383 n=1 Tax=Rhagoletis pomonella TaxID=28610 RepID=UPI00177DD9E6|nr:uncharacterized protein LOC118757383 [Rhagoletis pomonella]